MATRADHMAPAREGRDEEGHQGPVKDQPAAGLPLTAGDGFPANALAAPDLREGEDLQRSEALDDPSIRPVTCIACTRSTSNCSCRICDICIAERVERDCKDQGVPLFPTDPTVLRALAEVFGPKGR